MSVLSTPLGQCRTINPQNFAESRAVGIAIDSTDVGALTRVVSRGPVDGFTGLIPGRTYYAPIVPGPPVLYTEFATQYQAAAFDGVYLTAIAKALTETELSVNLSPPVFIMKDSADLPNPPAPTLTLSASVAPTSPSVNDTLTCTSSTTGGDAPVVTSFQWYQKLGVITGWTAFVGQTNSTFVIPGDRQGWEFRCDVTATSADGQVVEVVSNSTDPAN